MLLTILTIRAIFSLRALRARTVAYISTRNALKASQTANYKLVPKVKTIVQMCVRSVLDSLGGRLEVVRASEMTDLDARSAVSDGAAGRVRRY